MSESRRDFDQDFKEGAVRLVRETGRLIAQLAKDLGINAGRLANWVAWTVRGKEGKGRLNEDERLELARLRRETPSWPWSVMCASARAWSGRFPPGVEVACSADAAAPTPAVVRIEDVLAHALRHLSLVARTSAAVVEAVDVYPLLWEAVVAHAPDVAGQLVAS